MCKDQTSRNFCLKACGCSSMPLKPPHLLQRQPSSSWCCQFLTFRFFSVTVLFHTFVNVFSIFIILLPLLGSHFIFSFFSFCLFLVFFCFPFFLLFFFLSPRSPGCLVPSTATAAADDATHNAPQPQPPPLPPSFSQALLRSPIPTLPYLFSPSCLSYSLLSATLGSSRGIVMPAASTTGFSPIIATPTPVKSDVPLVQDAAGNTLLSLLVSFAHLLPHSPRPHFSLHLLSQ